MLKVLIIDDQPAVRTALETLFEVHAVPAVSVSTAVTAASSRVISGLVIVSVGRAQCSRARHSASSA